MESYLDLYVQIMAFLPKRWVYRSSFWVLQKGTPVRRLAVVQLRRLWSIAYFTVNTMLMVSGPQVYVCRCLRTGEELAVKA